MIDDNLDIVTSRTLVKRIDGQRRIASFIVQGHGSASGIFRQSHHIGIGATVEEKLIDGVAHQ